MDGRDAVGVDVRSVEIVVRFLSVNFEHFPALSINRKLPMFFHVSILSEKMPSVVLS
jgi:hypothetical protein